jgi:hypothetical protein
MTEEVRSLDDKIREETVSDLISEILEDNGVANVGNG